MQSGQKRVKCKIFDHCIIFLVSENGDELRNEIISRAIT